MGIIDELKLIIGYSGHDLDHVFALLSIFIVIMFFTSIFSILTMLFGGRSWKR